MQAHELVGSVDQPLIVEDWSGVRVVRDDLYPGGTKARVTHLLFDDREEYVYAGPCSGYAQVAVAHACRACGKRATVFVAERRVISERTAAAALAGAGVVEVPHGYLSNVRAKAAAYCRTTGAVLLPFGLADRRVVAGIADIARQVWPPPRQVWTVAGSGTLSVALQGAWPDAEVHAVLIGQRHTSIGRAHLWTAPEKYEQKAKEPPPFASCDNYDATAWRFILQHAAAGALFWNVAG